METKHIEYEGRNEEGEKVYVAYYREVEVGAYSTWDEAEIAVTAHIERVTA